MPHVGLGESAPSPARARPSETWPAPRQPPAPQPGPCKVGPGSVAVSGLALDPERPPWSRAQTDGGCPPVFQVPILVPCHRVVLSSGATGNYSGGMAVKEWLLAHEGRLAGKLACGGGSRPAGASRQALRGGSTRSQAAGQD